MREAIPCSGAGRSPAGGAGRPWLAAPAFAGPRLVLLALLALFLAFPASAQTFPKFTGLVVDEAGILPADRKAALEQKLEAFQQKTQRQFVVATIRDLQGYPIEDYGYRLGRAWGVGLKDADNGVILLVAPAEHKVRIEVGRRLEPVLTDALSSVIIQAKIVPAFKSGDMPGGIEAGADAIIAQLSAPDNQAKAEAAKAAQAFDRQHKHGSGSVPIGLIFWVFVVLFVILAMRRGRSGGGGPWGQRSYGDGGGSGWVWLWAASEMLDSAERRNRSSGGGFWDGGGGGSSGGGSDGSWGGGGFTGGGGGDFGGGGSSGSW